MFIFFSRLKSVLYVQIRRHRCCSNRVAICVLVKVSAVFVPCFDNVYIAYNKLTVLLPDDERMIYFIEKKAHSIA